MEVAPETCSKYVVCEGKTKVLYLWVLKAIYGLLQSAMLHLTLAVLFERKTSTGGATRLQWLVGNPGEYEPTMGDIKAALIEAMSHTTTHKRFMLTFKRGDKWHVPCKAGKNYVRGNEDFYHVLMTVNGLRKLRER